MSLSNKLKRLKAHLGVEETERRTERKSLNAEDQTNRIDEHQSTDKNGSVTDNDGRCTSSVENKHAWTALGAKPYFYVDQHIWVREQRIPLSEYQGPYRLEELYEILARWNDSRISHPLSARTLEAEQLLFFDTETTGMGGGTGNSIFLLGYSQFSTDAVVVKQYALPFPDCEVALYQAFLDDLHADHHIVSYNGKAFDWPQVKTRHTLLRNLLPQLPSVAHFDLLHAARRLWKEDLPSCRLQMIEEQILGITREEDTPGYLIPMLYFEYLKKQDPMILEGVLEHHRQDVLTLISLYVHLSKLLLDWDVSPSPNESYHIAKWYNQLGEKELALEHYHRVIHRESRWKPLALFQMARIYKQQGLVQQAIDCLKRCRSLNGSCRKQACIELAKLYEHKIHDAEQALHYALEAFELLQQQRALLRTATTAWMNEKELLLRRIERLEMKCG